MRANQPRFCFAFLDYVPMSALRRVGLANSRLVEAACGTIRLKLVEIGALAKIIGRRVLFSMGPTFP